MRGTAGVWFILIFTTYCCSLPFANCQYSNEVQAKDKNLGLNFDILVFTQRWPFSFCVQWEAKSHNNTCVWPLYANTWTIHGLWPTKKHTIGPGFCNHTLKFNETVLYPILDKLQIYWTNLEGHQTSKSLWKHEWLKHGTCAVQIPELNSEEKYFNYGLELGAKYNITDILSKSGIVPDNKVNYTRGGIEQALLDYTGQDGQIHCVMDKKGNYYLNEIMVCFDTDLNIMSCEGVIGYDIQQSNKVQGHGGCPQGRSILYLKSSSSSVFNSLPQLLMSSVITWSMWIIFHGKTVLLFI